MQDVVLAHLSQAEYLEKKLEIIEEKIDSQKDTVEKCNTELTDLYFQKGKIFSELELMKRVRPYKN